MALTVTAGPANWTRRTASC